MAKILVVDDEKNVADLISFLLEKDGHSVRSAGDGEACLAAVAAEKPDLIVLDVMMPVMDGYTVSARLLENEDTRHIPLLILTAKGQMRDAFEMASNVAEYVEKPFDPAGLRERIKKILDDKRV